MPAPDRRSDRPRLKRSFGQHHLRSGALCAPLLEFLALAPGSIVIEIGAGGGVLTRELVTRGARVLALELDLEWAFALGRGGRGGGAAPAQLVVGDALELDWSRLPPGARVAGNLPYNVGTVVVERLLRQAKAGTRAGFLLQREVVDRMVAIPGDEAYGALSVRVAMRARTGRLGTVRAGAFVPPPRVDSAFIGLETIAPPLSGPALDQLEAVVAVAFGQRRKSLRNALSAGFGRAAADRALAGAGIPPERRAEQLGLAEFLLLRQAFESARGAG